MKGTFASTTTCRPSARVTTRSGRTPAPSSLTAEGCSTKSQCSSSPATSTTRRSCTSPQRPRTCGVRRAVTRAAVSCLSWAEAWPTVPICSRSSPCAVARARSMPASSRCRWSSDSCTGSRPASPGRLRPSTVTTPSVTAVARSAPRRRPVNREAASMPRRVPEEYDKFGEPRALSRRGTQSTSSGETRERESHRLGLRFAPPTLARPGRGYPQAEPDRPDPEQEEREEERGEQAARTRDGGHDAHCRGQRSPGREHEGGAADEEGARAAPDEDPELSQRVDDRMRQR